MLLTEMVRSLVDEQSIAVDATAYKLTTTGDWTTLVSKSFTLDKTKLVCIEWDGTVSSAKGGVRVCSGSTPIASSGAMTSGAVNRRVMVILPAGSYTLNFQAFASTNTGYVQITNIKIGAFVFADMAGYTYQSSVVNCPGGVVTTVFTQSLTTPSTRILSIGSIKKYLAIILVNMRAQGSGYLRHNIPKNPGEADETAFNWKLYQAGVQVSWYDRLKDDNADSSNPTYGPGAYGMYIVALDPNTQYTFRFDVSNAYGTTYCQCEVNIIFCPWLIHGNFLFQPVTLAFPQQSTFYAVFEPLGEDNIKYSKIGCVRGISFGDTTDYYSTASGTGILTHNYTFEAVDIANIIWLVQGINACISIIGVDVR